MYKDSQNRHQNFQFINSRQSSHQKDDRKEHWFCVSLFIVFLGIFSVITYSAHQTYGTERQLQELQSLAQMYVKPLNNQQIKQNDRYWFGLSIQDLIIGSNLDSLYRRNRKLYSMNRQCHLRALLLTQLTHSITYRGQIQPLLSPFQSSQQTKRKVIQRLMQMQLDYYEEKYQLSKYNANQLRFCLVIPSYNNVKSKLYLRNLDSIFQQDYKNYHIVYIDDASPDKTGQHVSEYILTNKIPQQKINIIINSKNQGSLRNVYENTHKYCKQGEIVGIMDGDDSFIGRLVLKVYNAVYQRYRAGMVYSNFLKIQLNTRTNFGFGSIVTRQYFEAGNLRNKFPLLACHFRTFYYDLFKLIKKQDFCYQNGTFYDYSADTAVIVPIMQLSFPRIYYLEQMIYQYRNDTGINDGTKDWLRVTLLIKERPAYKSLESFPFIDQNEIIKNAQRQYQVV